MKHVGHGKLRMSLQFTLRLWLWLTPALFWLTKHPPPLPPPPPPLVWLIVTCYKCAPCMFCKTVSFEDWLLVSLFIIFLLFSLGAIYFYLFLGRVKTYVLLWSAHFLSRFASHKNRGLWILKVQFTPLLQSDVCVKSSTQDTNTWWMQVANGGLAHYYSVIYIALTLCLQIATNAQPSEKMKLWVTKNSFQVQKRASQISVWESSWKAAAQRRKGRGIHFHHIRSYHCLQKLHWQIKLSEKSHSFAIY